MIIKAKLEAVEGGISTIEREFFYDTFLPNVQTVGEFVGPQVEAAYEKICRLCSRFLDNCFFRKGKMERNRLEDFVKSNHGEQIVKLFHLVLRDPKWDVLVLPLNNGYDLYKMCAESGVLPRQDERIICSDAKIRNGQLGSLPKENPVIYLFFEIFFDINEASELYRVTKRQYPLAELHTIAGYLSKEDIEKEWPYIGDLSFARSLRYYKKGLPGETGSLSAHQTWTKCTELFPLFPDMPFFAKTTLQKQDFKRMCEKNDEWSFCENKNDFARNLHSGTFFLNKKIMSNRVLSAGVQCVCQPEEKELSFEPFVFLKSMKQDEVRKIFELIFKDFPDFCENAENHMMAKAVEFALHLYVGRSFANLFSSYDLEPDFRLLSDHYGKSFCEIIPDLWNGPDFPKTIEEIPLREHSYSVFRKSRTKLNRFPEDSNEAYGYCVLYFEMLERKRIDRSYTNFTIEEMENILKQEINFSNYDDIKKCLTLILQQMLRLGLIHKKIVFQDKITSVVYRVD